ncbi:MAG: type II secretion system F family protein [Candidatus Omnitrophota bacterium]|nr:MAG: type II secretion system F family protein [Candidatus Omnitrophota bacterium]
MPQFIYRARDKQGKERQATEEAATQEELIARLQKEGLLVTSVYRREAAVERKVVLSMPLHLKVTIDDMIIFARQLATMLEAGVTLLKSLDVLTRQIESRILLKAVQQIRHDIAAGSTFRDALAKHPGIFSPYWIQMVETGEASGALPLALAQLADYLETAAAIRRKITASLVYPAALVSIALVALTIFTVWIIPIFSRVFAGFNIELPLFTRMVIAFSTLMRRYLLFWVGGAVAVGYLINQYIHTQAGRWQFDYLKFKTPVLSSLFQRIAIERFASGLGTLIESGVPIVYGLDIVSKFLGNRIVERAVAEVRDSVRQGKGMAGPLEKSGVFTPMVVQMVSVGEEIGELGKMLKKASEFYRERISTTLTKIVSLIEPAVLVLMGIMVGVLVISMFLPIFQLAMVSRGG